MSTVLTELVSQLRLEKLEEHLFRGQSQDLGWGTVFGGQVLGQALSAAAQTVLADRHVHSLHAYFLRPGDVSKPIVYDVERLRDGASFTTRRVVAIQNGQPIFNVAVSFQKPEAGFEHQSPMPDAPEPLTLRTDQERAAAHASRLPPGLRERMLGERPFEFRATDPEDDPLSPGQRSPERRVWLKTVADLPDADDLPWLHACLLAYASDAGFISTAMLPHGVSWISPGMQVASLDHVMWFHQPLRVDDWLLYAMDSPSAHGARGLVRGQVFARSGALVASTAQEGLIRRRHHG